MSESKSAKHHLDEGQRLYAFKKYDDSAEEYAMALEKIVENTPALAPILHRYGRALLESAALNSGALGGGGTAGGHNSVPEPIASSSKPSGSTINNNKFSFSGDGDLDEEEEEEEEGGNQGEEEETDLDIAFQVLDNSRILFEKALKSAKNEGDQNEILLKSFEGEEMRERKIKARLAEVYNDLADAGLENENFLQASEDYTSSLQLLSPLVHPHSRRLADAHVRLALALEYHPTSSERELASRNIIAAAKVLEARLKSLELRLKTFESGDEEIAKVEAAASEIREEKAREEESVVVVVDTKGKGKATNGGGKVQEEEPEKLEKDDILEMNESKVKAEIKDCSEILEDLKLKLEEYHNNPNGNPASGSGSSSNPLALGGVGEEASATLKKALADAFLSSSDSLSTGIGSSSSTTSNPNQKVNDLSKMVKKKKKVENGSNGSEIISGSGSVSVVDGKRKAEDVNPEKNADENENKKARVEDSKE